MNIAELVAPARVITGLEAADKVSLLQELAQRAVGALGIDPVPVADALLARERLGSTGIGRGTALPHARLAAVAAPFGLFARLRRPIDFDAIDDQPVDLIFLLLLPKEGCTEQLNALACVARRFRDPALAAEVRCSSDSRAIFTLLTAA